MTTVTAKRWTPESTSTPTTRSDEWDLGVATGLIRVGAGLFLWRAPSTAIRVAGGSPDDGLLRVLFRYFAVRDIALGVATLASTRPGGNVVRSLTLQGVADTVDGAAVAALVGWSLASPSPAHAGHHLWRFTHVFSNASGSTQYIQAQAGWTA